MCWTRPRKTTCNDDAYTERDPVLPLAESLDMPQKPDGGRLRLSSSSDTYCENLSPSPGAAAAIEDDNIVATSDV
jgi:hypothetical protein